MADPFTWAMIGTAASVGQGIFGAMGAMQKGEAEASMYRYQAGVAELNSQIAKNNSEYARMAGEKRAAIQGVKSRQEIAQARARMGASGIAVDEGSSKDVLKSANELAIQEQTTIRENSAREAFGYDVAATKEKAQVGAYNASADNASSAGKINAMSSILGSVSSVSSKWSSGISSGLYS